MAQDVVHIVNQCFQYSFDIFITMLERTGLANYYLANLAILLIVTYLLGNFLVPVGSDTVTTKSTKISGKRNYRERSSRYDRNSSGGKTGGSNPKS